MREWRVPIAMFSVSMIVFLATVFRTWNLKVENYHPSGYVYLAHHWTFAWASLLMFVICVSMSLSESKVLRALAWYWIKGKKAYIRKSAQSEVDRGRVERRKRA